MRAFPLAVVLALAFVTSPAMAAEQEFICKACTPVTEPPIEPPGGGTPPSPDLFPPMGSQAASVYPWKDSPPGVTLNGGIPARATQCGPTLMPKGNGANDAPQIQSAINACPDGQHVQLGSGVFVFPTKLDAILIKRSNVTLRGMGPGPGGAVPNDSHSIPSVSACKGAPCTIIYMADWPHNDLNALIWVNQFASDLVRAGPPISLAEDGDQGALTVALASPPSGPNWAAGRLALIDVVTADAKASSYQNAPIWPSRSAPELFYTAAFGPLTSQWWKAYGRADRHLNQVVKIKSVSGNTVTLDAPLSMKFAVANGAQLTPWDAAQVSPLHAVGIEDLYLYGGGGGFGNISITLCDGCWVKHVESHWFNGASINFSSCYKCELRDSYLHESSLYRRTGSGGAAYLLSLDQGTANSLVENNIMWNGNKQMVMRTSGGGNVIGYNYMDDAWGDGAPVAQEAGANAGHFIGSHMELFEGDWSHKMSGDSWWGNAIYITAFRNHFTGLRGAHGWLDAFVNGNGYPYCDCWNRTALTLQTYGWWYNIVGNVFGFAGQESTLLNGPVKGTTFEAAQTGWRYEDPTATGSDTEATMYEIGATQDNSGFPADPEMYKRTNRQGNFDYVTRSQIWYAGAGGKGEVSTGAPKALPDSLYLKAKPAFFGANPWPWVDPSTGTVHVLPAKARFDKGAPNALP